MSNPSSKAPSESGPDRPVAAPEGGTSDVEAVGVVSITILMLTALTAGALLTRVVPVEAPHEGAGQATTSAGEKAATDAAPDSTALGQMVRSEQAIQAGADIFETNCIACHGPQGSGLVGPNLTDEYWLHGGRNQDIYRAVTEGFPRKGMTAFGAILSEEERLQVTAYVRSLEGTNPPSAKAPQGEPVE